MKSSHTLALALVFVSIACTPNAASPNTPPEATPQATARTPGGFSLLPATRADRAQWKAAVDWSKECEDAFVATHEGDSTAGISVHDIGNRKAIATVGCALGAYQPSQVLVLVDQTTTPPRTKVLTAPLPPKVGEASTEVLGLVSFAGDRIELLAKSRGIGDCGHLATYKLVGDSLELTELRARECGKGTPTEADANARKWPMVSLQK